MNEEKYKELIDNLKEEVEKSFFLVESSLIDLKPYDINAKYTPKELEPYDALSDRFIRCVEVFLKYFKAYEYYKFAVKSDTVRDGLNIIEKVGIITNTPVWMDMRDIRNRIVHDYLPEQIKDMFDFIMNEFYKELLYTKEKINANTLS